MQRFPRGRRFMAAFAPGKARIDAAWPGNCGLRHAADVWLI
jgi:hypothetical protein